MLSARAGVAWPSTRTEDTGRARLAPATDWARRPRRRHLDAMSVEVRWLRQVVVDRHTLGVTFGHAQPRAPVEGVRGDRLAGCDLPLRAADCQLELLDSARPHPPRATVWRGSRTARYQTVSNGNPAPRRPRARPSPPRTSSSTPAPEAMSTRPRWGARYFAPSSPSPRSRSTAQDGNGEQYERDRFRDLRANQGEERRLRHRHARSARTGRARSTIPAYHCWSYLDR